MCDFGVKSQVLGPWIVSSCHLSIKGGDVRTGAHCLSLLVKNGGKLDFLYYHKWADFQGCSTRNIYFPQAQLIFVSVYLQYAFLNLHVSVLQVCVKQRLMCVSCRQFYTLFPPTIGEALVSKELQLPRPFLISVYSQPTRAINNHQTLMNSATLFAGFNDLRPRFSL